MAETRRRFDPEFRAGAARIVRETGKPIAQVAKDLGINEGTLGNWVSEAGRRGDGGALSESEREKLARLRRKNVELAMERDDAPILSSLNEPHRFWERLQVLAAAVSLSVS